ncbi:MAG: hypothetical protein LH609_02600, partial [Rudanella sp.]|nr:hypothetical protein [Rudanella sp.]
MQRVLYLLFAYLGVVTGILAQTNVTSTVQVHSGGHMAEYNVLTFTSGYVVTPRNEPTANLSFRPGSSYGGASDASHVNGYTEKVGTTAFTFPVGDGTTLRPAGMSAPTSGTFQAAYF